MASTQPTVKLEYHEKTKERMCLQGPFQISSLDSDSTTPLLKSSEWTATENAKYIAFVGQNYHRMQGKSHGRLWVIHQQMARFIQTRNFRQCKLYHQRLSNQFGTLARIVSFLSEKHPEFQVLVAREKNKISEKQKHTQVKKLNSKQNGINTENSHDKKMREDLIPTDFAYRNEENTDSMSRDQKKLPSLLQGGSMIAQTRKWEQCHKFFMQWTSKLNGLVSQ